MVKAEELIFSMNKRRLPGYILKVDFVKVFDLVDWDFLLDLLRARDFGPKWLEWIQLILFFTKANVLIKGSPNGYIQYLRGLLQEDPLYPLLFILVTDVLSSIFKHALVLRVLVGVPLGSYNSSCNLHYANDLLVLTMGGLEDLRIVKLILYLFEGISGLQVNYSKTSLYSARRGWLPGVALAGTMNCDVAMLPLTYLGVPISGGRPRKQDWEGLIAKMRKCLTFWKSKHLLIGGRLTLLNSVLSAIPTYWMSVFKLPKWVIKAIKRVRRDFLWSGPDIDKPGCRLISWKVICRAREQGGWGILDLNNFNLALLGKWWCKFAADRDWGGAEVIQFNYGCRRWDMFPRGRGRISFFWKGVLSVLPALRCGVSSVINSGTETYFWKDRWLSGRAPMNVWHDLFRSSNQKEAVFSELVHLLESHPFCGEADIVQIVDR